ncbi:YceD family protein [Pseudochelatococcus contaminans]|uniref:DUF177 domain-containing protein n=1 Tax=Pseudochelatococcus contaminans TaxID=1538103 RepID=A0A7W6EH95_9HYPH|nr:DUF177 domain-containing protein [Pseudochelatococcus contaminans]MBB3809976.1 hypothetical protein [Pseudochelatococcus contaminans]
MTETISFPLQHIFNVTDLKPEGVDVTVETTAEERAALAKFLDLPAIHHLEGTFHLTGNARRVTVRGEVRAAIVQTCTVSLDPFDTSIHEDVEVVFEEPAVDALDANAKAALARGALDKPIDLKDLETELDAPDDLIDGKIDLGSLTAEFLALGLDPYPRKPGVEFSFDDGSAERESPFAALSGLKGSAPGGAN